MLSTTAARGLGPQDGGVPPEARCLASFYDQIYIGTDDGRVCLIFNGQQQSYTIPGGKPIVQLLALGEIGLLLALSNGIVESIDAQRLCQRPNAKPSVRGEVLGLVQNESAVPNFSICVFTSHKAHLFRWAGEKYEPWKVLNIPSPALDAAWSLHKICVALEDQIMLIDVPSGRMLKVHEFPNDRRRKRRSGFGFAATGAATNSSGMATSSPGGVGNLGASVAEPSSGNILTASPGTPGRPKRFSGTISMTPNYAHLIRGSNVSALSQGRFLMIVDGLGIVIDSSGQPSGSTIVWSTPPLRTVCTLDFAVSLHDDGRQIQVHSTDPQGLVSEFSVLETPAIALVAPAPWNAQATQSAAGQDIETDASEPILENLTAGGGVFLLTSNAVLNLGTVSLRRRMEEFFDMDDVSGAFRIYSERVLNPIEEAHKGSSRAHTQTTLRRLARQISTHDTLLPDLINSPDHSTHSDLIAHFHLEAALAMLRRGRFAKAFQQFGFAKLDLRELIAQFPGLQPPYVEKYNPKRLRRTNFDISSSQDDLDDEDIHAYPMLLRVENRTENTKDELLTTFKEYLKSQRSKGIADSEIAAFVDFALFRLFVDPPHSEGDVQALHKLCASPNSLEVDTCAHALLDKEQYHAAALLLGSSSSHRREALEIWADIGKGKYAESGIDGVAETINFLRAHHEDPQLVWSFAPWVLERDPESAVQIFTEPTQNSQGNLDPETVLDQLCKYDTSPRSRLCLTYLQKLSADESMDPSARAFDLQTAQEFIRVLEKCPASLREENRENFFDFIDRPETLTLRVEEPGTHHRTTFQADLIARQLEQQQNDLNDAMLPERVELYSKCGWHNTALAVLIKDLDDPKAAEAYCVKHYARQQLWFQLQQQQEREQDNAASILNVPEPRQQGLKSTTMADFALSSSPISRTPSPIRGASTSSPGSKMLASNQHLQPGKASNPFLELVCLYFEPELASKYRAESLSILEKYGSVIDPGLVTSKLPADMRLSDLQGYLAVIFRANVQKLSQLRVEKNLCVAQNIKTLYQLSRRQKRNFSITQDTQCRICAKKILTEPFAVDPNLRSVVHQACLGLAETPGK